MSSDEENKSVSIAGESSIRTMVASAELVPNPINGLLDRVKENVGEAFQPDVLDALKQLRDSDRPRYETTLAALRRCGVRTAELEAAMYQKPLIKAELSDLETGGSGDLKGLLDEMVMFRSPLGEIYAGIQVRDHQETWLVDSEDFSDLLTQHAFEAYGEPPSKDEIRGAVALARARGKFNGEEQAVHLRVAEANGHIYIDLGDRDWRAIEITADGWSIISAPPVRFTRSPGYQALPEPQAGGSVTMLRKYVNVADDGDFQLIVAWLLSALRPGGPYPLLALSGQQGSSKSTLTGLLKAIVDPHAVPLRTSPRDERDLLIAAKHTHVIALDNVSRITSEMSDAFCRLSTGSGLATRRLFRDASETLFAVCRPVILNGIEEIVARPDLADRTLFVELVTIDRGTHKSLGQLRKQFAADLPFILGGLLDVMAYGLRKIDGVPDQGLPRMADAARWIIACESALWPTGTFMTTLARSARAAIESLAERTPAVAAIARLMDKQQEWQGTASQLLAELPRELDTATRNARILPQTPAQLGTQLRGRFAPLLRDLGIEVSTERSGRNRDRLITLRRLQEPDAPAASADHSGKNLDADDIK